MKLTWRSSVVLAGIVGLAALPGCGGGDSSSSPETVVVYVPETTASTTTTVPPTTTTEAPTTTVPPTTTTGAPERQPITPGPYNFPRSEQQQNDPVPPCDTFADKDGNIYQGEVFWDPQGGWYDGYGHPWFPACGPEN